MLQVRDELSAKAQEIYDLMVEYMDEKGYLAFEDCMKVTLEGIGTSSDVGPLTKALSELQRHSLVFPHTSRSGWVVRLPLRA